MQFQSKYVYTQVKSMKELLIKLYDSLNENYKYTEVFIDFGSNES